MINNIIKLGILYYLILHENSKLSKFESFLRLTQLMVCVAFHTILYHTGIGSDFIIFMTLVLKYWSNVPISIVMGSFGRTCCDSLPSS